MHDAVHSCVTECGWRLRTLMRTRRYYSVAELIQLYKAQILSFIEYRTAAVAHAADSTLAPLDALQTRFLRDIGVSPREALCHHGLAPLV
eukprot:4029154-Alexandrium_andersonii.AAC.1